MELVMKRQIDKHNKNLQQIKYTDPINEKDNVCPQKEDNMINTIIVIIISTFFSTIFAALVVFLYFKSRPKEN